MAGKLEPEDTGLLMILKGDLIHTIATLIAAIADWLSCIRKTLAPVR